MDSATRQILDEADRISQSTNFGGQGMNPIIPPTAMSIEYGRLCSLEHSQVTNLEECKLSQVTNLGECKYYNLGECKYYSYEYIVW